MRSASSSSSSPSSSTEQEISERVAEKLEREQDEARRAFECNICLELADDPVISLCGHLYCWPCIYQWLSVGPDGAEGATTCPVCKSALAQNRLIPLYGRDRKKDSDAPEVTQEAVSSSAGSIPDRPKPPQSPDPPLPTGSAYRGGRHQHNDNRGMHMSFGFGLFPFGGFSLHNFGEHIHQQPLTPRELQRQTISKVLMAIGMFILFVLLM